MAFSELRGITACTGMTNHYKVRNTYSLFDYGDWVNEASNDRQEPYIQLLSVTNVAQAHADFVKVRMNGVDTSGSASQQLVPADQGQKSPVSKAEKKKLYVRRCRSVAVSAVAAAPVGAGCRRTAEVLAHALIDFARQVRRDGAFQVAGNLRRLSCLRADRHRHHHMAVLRRPAAPTRAHRSAGCEDGACARRRWQWADVQHCQRTGVGHAPA